MATDLSGLKNFAKKLEKIGGQTSDFKHQLVKKITQRGKEIAQQEYDSSNIKKVNVTKHSNKNGTGQIIAEGEKLAYIEFGTGRKGESSNYPTENLPKEGVPITGEWEYYYPSEHKVTKDGKEGWMWGKVFMEGQEAGMQMYRTSKRLEQEMKSMVKEFVKEVKKNG